MNILFVSNKIGIFKVDSGGANRNNMMVKVLARLGHVDVVSFWQEEVNSDVANCDVVYSAHIDDYHGYLEAARSLLGFTLFPKNPYSYYRKHKKKETIIDKLVEKNKYDLIVCRYVDDTIKCGLLKYASKLVIDVDDNPAGVLRYQTVQVDNRLLKWKKLLESRRISRMVEKVLERVYCSFYSNQLDPPSERSVFLHNSTVVTKSVPELTDSSNHRILFVGNVDFFPCRQGLFRFLESIFPLVRARVPDVKLIIVGRGKTELLVQLNSIEGVKALGRVEDLAEEYQRSNVVVIPIYYGSGTSVKFIEALMMNRPVVSTPIGARGYDGICEEGEHYMLANDDEEFARKTIELLESVEKARRMARKGRELAIRNFSQEKFFKIVESQLKR